MAALVLLTALVGGPSQLDGEAQAGPNGTALAWEMAEKLKMAAVDEAYVVARLRELDNNGLTRFLSALRRQPVIQVATQNSYVTAGLLSLQLGVGLRCFYAESYV